MNITSLDSTKEVERLEHDGNITLATATSRLSTFWKNTEMTWGDFLTKLSETVRTKETVAEYNKMSKAEQSEIKDVGGFVGGFLKEGKRRSGNVMNRSMLTLDIDFADEGMNEVISMFFGHAYALYSTHKHREHNPRLRLVIPLKRHVNSEEYQAVARKVADSIGIDYFDDTTYQPHRLMYWPSTSSDAEFYFSYEDLPFIDPDEVLAEYTDWKNPIEWPTSTREQSSYKNLAAKQGDPHEKKGIVGAFNRAYDIHDVIETFLSDVYEKYDDNRYTYAEGSAAGGLVLYEEGKFAYSHHGTDPISGELVNSFDMVRLHKFGVQDEDIVEGTPINRFPSYKAMQALAKDDAGVKAQLIQDKFTAEDDFADIEIDEEAKNNREWTKKLTINNQGEIEATVPNIALILENEPLLKGKIAYNRFNGRLCVMGKTTWRNEDTVANWRDADDAGLRNYLETYYGIYNRSKTDDAVMKVSEINQFHPVVEYLEPLEWDGVERLERLFIDHLGAEDNEVNRVVTRKAFAAAVARVYEPAIKFDYMITLYGAQGVGKSALLARMGGEWFTDSITSVTGKEAYEALQGAWLVEMGELAATKKAEVESIKHFISKQVDSFRVAYGRHKEDFPRQCVFFGTTNQEDFLRDDTGGRRFWPITVKAERATKHWTDLTKDVVQQLWAEAKHYYMEGELLKLEAEHEREMNDRQAYHTQDSPLEGVIRDYLDIQIPKNWYDLDMQDRRAYISSQDIEVIDADENDLVDRERICALEIWVECLGNEKSKFPKMQQVEIRNILNKLEEWEPYQKSKTGRLRFNGGYGVQKAFIKPAIFNNE